MTLAPETLRTDTTTPLSPTAVLEVVQGLARELQPQRQSWRGLTLDASLERDLGLDSLGRVELLARMERAFGVRLPEELLGTAETPRDLLQALLTARPGTSGAALEMLELPREAGEAAPDRTRTLLEVLDWHAQRHPERRHVLFYPGDGEPEELTYGELARRARAVAYGLARLGVGPGQAVGIMLPTGLEYFAAFFGAQLAGGVPVPLYPPARKSQIEDHLRRQAGILQTAGAVVLIAFPEVLTLARLLSAQLPGLSKVTTVAELSKAEPVPDLPPVKGEDIAFLQFTSGSTGNPKGVVLTHANLLANLRAIGKGGDLGPEDVCVSWLPLYHDMGLIGCWMGTLYFGIPLVLMSPLTFLARPSRWLWAIHRHRATVSAAPNFAYELCVAKIPDEEIEGLDLSSWRIAFNGAEPVSPEVMGRFTERYSRHGFEAGAMLPVYGLAENSLGVAFPPLGRRAPLVDAIQRDAFQRSGQALPAEPDNPSALRFVSCGLPLPDHEVRIVDDAGREVGERRQGRLEFKGPSATSGYFRNPEATAKLVHGEWRDSGDLAYIANGEVYITGRTKDVIIRAGRNLYPHELEGVVGSVPGVRKGCVAVFGSADPASGTERLVILAETRERGEETLERLRQAIQDATVDLLGTPADEVVLAPPNTVPKTSSGKIRRSSSREIYEAGRIGKGGSGGLGWQLARLAASGARAQVARRLRSAGDLLYALWFYFGVLFWGVPIWLLVVAAPGLSLRRRLAQKSARFVLRWVGISARVEGLENLAAGKPLMVAANHASYLDGFVLTALLPPDFSYVVKRELEGHFVPRALLRRLRTLFVERFDPTQGAGETRKVLETVQSGQSLVIFPEGTFQRYPGLLPFRMGAFAVAVDAALPVVPVVIQGTRGILRGDDFFPRRDRITVTVMPPIAPEGSGWHAGVRLRDSVRAKILAACGEPDLAS